MASNIDQIQRASAACREAAEALDNVKPFLRHGSILPVPMVNTDALIKEADHLDQWVEVLKEEGS